MRALAVRTTQILVVFGSAIFAQQPAIRQASFEVASVKPSQDPLGSVSGISESKAGISAKNVTLKRCVRGAYGIDEARIVGGPKWASEDRFHIEATTAVPAGDQALMLMLQTLLSERFRLVIHREQRLVSGYRLVLGKGGLKATRSDRQSVGTSSRGRIECVGCTLAQLATKLSEALHQPVLDAAGVEGKFDVKLEWTPGDMQTKPPSVDQGTMDVPEGPTLFTALQEQVGLKLESGKISAEVLVIDSAEKPSEN